MLRFTYAYLPSIHQSIPYFFHTLFYSIHTPIHPSSILYFHPAHSAYSFKSSILPSIHLFIYQVHPPIFPSIHSSSPPTHQFAHLFIFSSILVFFHPSIHQSTNLVHSSSPPFIQDLHKVYTVHTFGQLLRIPITRPLSACCLGNTFCIRRRPSLERIG